MFFITAQSWRGRGHLPSCSALLLDCLCRNLCDLFRICFSHLFSASLLFPVFVSATLPPLFVTLSMCFMSVSFCLLAQCQALRHAREGRMQPYANHTGLDWEAVANSIKLGVCGGGICQVKCNLFFLTYNYSETLEFLLFFQ